MFAVVINHGEQNFIMRMHQISLADRLNFLAAQFQAIFIQRTVDARDPGNHVIAFAKARIAGFDHLNIFMPGFFAHVRSIKI